MRTPRRHSRAEPDRGLDGFSVAAASIVIAAAVFNAALAAVNGHVTHLSPAAVIAFEAGLVVAAHAIAIARFKPQMTPWYALLLVFATIAALRGLSTEAVEVKYLRDVLIIPTFILLGMAFDGRGLTRTIVALHAIVLAVLFFEAFATEAYSDLFRIEDYYINTRGYDPKEFYNEQSDLYVSATRPDDRFFSFLNVLDLHRMSSIFLEPVSLGNYCIVIVVFLCATFKSLGNATRAFLIAGVVVMLLACDGRLATVSSLLVIAAAMCAPYLPRGSAAIYLPGVTAAAFTIVAFGGLHAGRDDFAGRIAHTVDLIQRFDLAELLGASNEYLSKAVDSGLAYLILTQSLIGLVVLWLFLTLVPAQKTAEQARFTHGASLYVALTMMVSFSFVSIKTAALLWFIGGALQIKSWPDALRSTRRAAPFLPQFHSPAYAAKPPRRHPMND